jgi:ESF2/ABP1 family protein
MTQSDKEHSSDSEKESVDDSNHEEVEHDEEKDINDDTTDDIQTVEPRKKKPHKLSLVATEDFNAKLKKRGVIYLARVPPRMGPTKVKQILSDFGVVTRIYLEPEDKAAKKRRQRATGSKSGGKRYKEGWIEYESKKVAKRVASTLNNTSITNHKRSVHFGDLWSMKYLNKFQWDHLTEKVAYERRMREQKLRIEMVNARRENQAYSNLVEAGKVMDRIDKRRQKRDNEDGGGNATKKSKKDDAVRATRKFKQTKPVNDKSDRKAKKSVLSSLV